VVAERDVFYLPSSPVWNRKESQEAVLPIALVTHVPLGKALYPSPKYFSTVVRSVAFGLMLQGISGQCSGVGATETGRLLHSLPDLSSKLCPS